MRRGTTIRSPVPFEVRRRRGPSGAAQERSLGPVGSRQEDRFDEAVACRLTKTPRRGGPVLPPLAAFNVALKAFSEALDGPEADEVEVAGLLPGRGFELPGRLGLAQTEDRVSDERGRPSFRRAAQV